MGVGCPEQGRSIGGCPEQASRAGAAPTIVTGGRSCSVRGRTAGRRERGPLRLAGCLREAPNAQRQTVARGREGTPAMASTAGRVARRLQPAREQFEHGFPPPPLRRADGVHDSSPPSADRPVQPRWRTSRGGVAALKV